MFLHFFNAAERGVHMPNDAIYLCVLLQSWTKFSKIGSVFPQHALRKGSKNKSARWGNLPLLLGKKQGSSRSLVSGSVFVFIARPFCVKYGRRNRTRTLPYAHPASLPPRSQPYPCPSVRLVADRNPSLCDRPLRGLIR